MSGFRRHPISGEPIVYAPERAGRPNAFGRTSDDTVCPFCPGNEALTPPPIAEVGKPWRIRIFANKYPAVGGHEVIVESQRHDAGFENLENAAEVVRLYIERYRAHADAAYVSVFKNEGERSGASIDHVHSQVMPLPFVPPRVAREAAAFASAASCPLCAPRENVIEANDDFLRFAPDGSQHSYEQWIVPKRHQASFVTANAGALASILQNAVRATRSVSRSYNVLFMNFPEDAANHFYVQVFPRLAALAGFELASGMFIDIIDPAAAAKRLK